MTYKIYLLELIGGLYYVGLSSNPGRRFDEHCAGTGAIICRKNKPVRILKTIDTGTNDLDLAKQVENFNTISIANLYGPERVYGGVYCHESYRGILHTWMEEEWKRVALYAHLRASQKGITNWSIPVFEL